jgi:hypothetical protein
MNVRSGGGKLSFALTGSGRFTKFDFSGHGSESGRVFSGQLLTFQQLEGLSVLNRTRGDIDGNRNRVRKSGLPPKTIRYYEEIGLLRAGRQERLPRLFDF